MFRLYYKKRGAYRTIKSDANKLKKIEISKLLTKKISIFKKSAQSVFNFKERR